MPVGTQTVGGSSSCIISGNTISPGNFYDGSSNGTVYTYQHGGIWARNSANITNNTYRTTTPSTSSSASTSDIIPILLSNGTDFNVTNNRIERESISIGNYIGFKFLSNYPSVGLENDCRGIITENIFDSHITNGSNTDTIDLNINGTMGNSSWIINNNINQTVVREINVNQGFHYAKIEVGGSYVRCPWSPEVMDYLITHDVSSDGYLNSLDIGYYGINASGASGTYGVMYELTSLIPVGVKIVSIVFKNASYAHSGTADEYFAYLLVRLSDSSNLYEQVVEYTNSNTDYETTITPTNLYNRGITQTVDSLKVITEITFKHTANMAAENNGIVITYRW